MSGPHKPPLTDEASSRLIQTRRWRLHVNDFGEGSPIIFLHGTGPGATGWSNFHQNVAGFIDRHRVLLLDLPGWGRSDAFDCTGESRSAANAEAVRLLMDELGLERAAIVGNSMGGAATLEFMARHPERISHAVTMGAGLFGPPNLFSPGGLSTGLRVIIETYKDPSPANFQRLVEVMVYDRKAVPGALAEERSRAALASPLHLTNWLKGAIGHPHGPFGGVEALMTKLASSSVPTMLVHGRDDRTVPMETSLRAAALIPNSRLVVLNRCGHWAQLEHAAEFNQLVRGFLALAPQGR